MIQLMFNPWSSVGFGASPPYIFHAIPNHDYGVEQYKDFDLWIGMDGTSTVHMLEHSIDFTKGRLLLIPSGVPVRLCTSKKNPIKHLVCHFDCLLHEKKIFDASPFVDAKSITLALRGIPEISLMGEVDSESLCQKLLHLRQKLNDELGQLTYSIHLWEIFRHLRRTRLNLHISRDHECLEKIIHYFENNLDKTIRLSDASLQAGISPETMGRLFRKHYQCSPMKYLNRLRLSQARDMLRSQKFHVGEIGFNSGFNSVQYFSRAFKKEYGISPQKFRIKATG